LDDLAQGIVVLRLLPLRAGSRGCAGPHCAAASSIAPNGPGAPCDASDGPALQ